MKKTFGLILLLSAFVGGCTHTKTDNPMKINVGPIDMRIASVQQVPFTKTEKDPARLECLRVMKINRDNPDNNKYKIAYIYENNRIKTCFVNRGGIGEHLINLVKNKGDYPKKRFN